MEVPVYLFTGFLEAGKTKFIQETLEDARFNSGERTLLLLCEQGFTEYDKSRFAKKNVHIAVIEDEKSLTGKTLSDLMKKHKTQRIIVEYNGMWQLDALYNNLPQNCTIYQEMLFVDAQTFVNYNNNMRALVVDKLKSCEVVIFNRTTEATDKELCHKIVRGTTRRANIVFEYTDGHVEYDEIEDPLPFDINAPVVAIQDQDFALWYRDISEDIKKYEEKTVMFKGIVAHNNSMPDDTCLIGRHIMTCCEDDIAYGGMLCVVPKSVSFQNRDWMLLTAVVRYEYHPLYEGEGPVLYAKSMVPAPPPQNPLATFY